MTYYVRLEDKTRRIIDVISYEYEGYVPVEVEGELPKNFYAGCYFLKEDGTYYRDDVEYDKILRRNQDEDYLYLMDKYDSLKGELEEIKSKIETT